MVRRRHLANLVPANSLGPTDAPVVPVGNTTYLHNTWPIDTKVDDSVLPQDASVIQVW